MTNQTQTTAQTNGWPAYRVGETPVPSSDELLWRQIHPNYVKEAVVDGLAFEEISLEAMTGTPAARDEVSADRSGGANGVTARAAFEAWVAADRKTAGTFAVSASEVEGAGARVVDDSVAVSLPSHAYIDLRGVQPATKAGKRRVRSELASAATIRRRQHPRPSKQ